MSGINAFQMVGDEQLETAIVRLKKQVIRFKRAIKSREGWALQYVDALAQARAEQVRRLRVCASKVEVK